MDFLQALERSGAVPQDGNGVATPAAVGNGLKVSGICVALEDPTLSTTKAPIGLLVRGNNRELVLKIIPEQHLSGERPDVSALRSRAWMEERRDCFRFRRPRPRLAAHPFIN
jgi:hypothetical protein